MGTAKDVKIEILHRIRKELQDRKLMNHTKDHKILPDSQIDMQIHVYYMHKNNTSEHHSYIINKQINYILIN